MGGEDPEKLFFPRVYANPRLKTTDLYSKLRIVPGSHGEFNKYEL